MFIGPVPPSGPIDYSLPTATTFGKSGTMLRMKKIREVAKPMEEPHLPLVYGQRGALVLSVSTRNLGFRFAQEMS
jgi:hypothetical protein